MRSGVCHTFYVFVGVALLLNLCFFAVDRTSARAGFEDAGASRARRVALITKLVRRAAARGRARVEHGAAAVGLHLCWRLYWFRSL